MASLRPAAHCGLVSDAPIILREGGRRQEPKLAALISLHGLPKIPGSSPGTAAGNEARHDPAGRPFGAI